MGKVNKKVLFVSIFSALFATLLLFYYVKNNGTDTSIKYTKTYISVKDIEENKQITEADIKEVSIPENTLVKNAAIMKEEIVGKYTTENIHTDEQFIKTQLVTDLKKTSILEIPDGKRAVSITIDEASSVSYYIKKGDFVDIIANLKKEGAIPNISKIVLQDIEVLAVGSSATIGAKDGGIAKTLVLAASPVDAEKITYLDNFESTRLILRQKEDHTQQATGGAIKNSFK